MEPWTGMARPAGISTQTGGIGAFHHIYVNAAIRVDAGQHVRHWRLYFQRVFRIFWGRRLVFCSCCGCFNCVSSPPGLKRLSSGIFWHAWHKKNGSPADASNGAARSCSSSPPAIRTFFPQPGRPPQGGPASVCALWMRVRSSRAERTCAQCALSALLSDHSDHGAAGTHALADPR